MGRSTPATFDPQPAEIVLLASGDRYSLSRLYWGKERFPAHRSRSWNSSPAATAQMYPPGDLDRSLSRRSVTQSSIERPAATIMRPCRAEVGKQGLIAAAHFLYGIGQHRLPVRVRLAIVQAFGVGTLRQCQHQAGLRRKADGPQAFAEDLPERVRRTCCSRISLFWLTVR